jgi:hypothetical protein
VNAWNTSVAGKAARSSSTATTSIVPRRIRCLAPNRFDAAVQGNRKLRREGDVIRSDVELDQKPVRTVIAVLVQQHVTVGHEEQPLVAREEKTGGVR